MINYWRFLPEGRRQGNMARNSYYLFWGYYFAFSGAGQACFSR